MEPTNYLKTLKEHLNSDNVEFQFAKNELVVNVPFNQIKVKYLRCKLSKVNLSISKIYVIILLDFF